MTDSVQHILARQLADLFAQFPQVEAVAMAGSLTSGAEVDPAADIDLCIYITAPVPPEQRAALVEQLGGASRASLNHDFWGPTDEWVHAGTGLGVDCVYWDTRWMEEMLERILVHHQASLGYTTAFWHTVLHSQVLFDRNGWFSRLQSWSRQPYPEPLRQAVITRNLMVLRDMIPSYRNQIAKAVRRGDLVSINHRVAALMSSYFDILFAYNRVAHPGEKRLVQQALRLCQRLPEDWAGHLERVLRCAGTTDEQILVEIDRLVDGVEQLVRQDASC